MFNGATVLIALTIVFGVLTLVFVTALCRAYVSDACVRISRGDEDERISNIMAERRAGSARRSRVLLILKRIAIGAVVAAALFAAVQAVVFRMSGGREYFGRVPLAVASGSMSYVEQSNTLPEDVIPGFNALDLIFIDEAEQSELALYDIVAYRSAGGTIIIHRIVRVTQLGGRTYYLMRGDANSSPDGALVSYEAIIGKYSGAKIPFVGAAVLFLQSWMGLATIAVLIYIACIYENSVKRIGEAERLRYAVIDE